VQPPPGWTAHAVDASGGDERRQDVARPAHEIAANLARIVVLDEAAQPAVSDRADDHDSNMYGEAVRCPVVGR
jgi:hypothetical protein